MASLTPAAAQGRSPIEPTPPPGDDIVHDHADDGSVLGAPPLSTPGSNGGPVAPPLVPVTVNAPDGWAPADANWMPLLGTTRMWCTKANPGVVGVCSYHHNGWAIDIDTAFGQPIFAAGSGTVRLVFGGCAPRGVIDGGCNWRAGNYVTIQHGDYMSRYLHLASINPDLDVGDPIDAGTLVGWAGASGTSDGAVHLHYDETSLNPNERRQFFGPMWACHGTTPVRYPDVLGYTDWPDVPAGTTIRNDNYVCLGGLEATPPPLPSQRPVPPPVPASGAVASGDVNGDGVDDLILGAPGEDLGELVDGGAVHVVLGVAGSGASGRSWELSQGNGLTGLTEAGDLVGAALAVGDFDCDGLDDIAMGAPAEDVGSTIDAGAVNVVYGTASGPGNRQQLLTQDGGLPGLPTAGDRLGAALAAGDFDADGCADLAIGVPGETVNGASAAGMVQVVRGTPRGLTSSNAPSLAQGSGLGGLLESGDFSAAALAAADLNCDGYADLAVGAPGEDLDGRDDAGLISVVNGSDAGLGGAGSLLWQSNGLTGVLESGDAVGMHVTTGDLNNDGCGDLVVGVAGEGIGPVDDAGAVNVVYGASSGLGRGATAGRVLYQGSGLADAAERHDHLGASTTVADLNCDGVDDLVVGVPGEGRRNRDGAGIVQLLLGTHAGVTDLEATLRQGKLLNNRMQAGDAVGAAVGGGDFDGNGCADLVVAAPGEGSSRLGDDIGVVHLVYGVGTRTPRPPTMLFSGRVLSGQPEGGDHLGGLPVLHGLG